MPSARDNYQNTNARTSRGRERRQLLTAMAQFDASQRDRYWRGWEQQRSAQYAIRQGERLYPARHLVSMAIEQLRYKSMTLVVAFLRALGFQVVELTHKPQRIDPPAQHNRRRARAGGRRMTRARLAQFDLTLAPATAPTRVFRTEREFELQVIEPHLKGWGCHCATQVTRTVYRGKRKLPGRIDFVVRRRKNGPLITVIEAKREIRSLAQLYHAARQAESYARALRLRHFVVAAPDGCWIFSRTGRTFHQVEVYGADIWDGHASPLQARLYELGGYSPL